MIVRFQYSKLGSASYIGHLEMTKLFERTFRRSGVVVKYTEGFNPTVKLNFASPLSVGIESEYEVAEVEIEDESFACFSKLDLP
ncbi:MAG: TIGR03936 family radical SAM-associated protein, partial [Bacillota bacterium]|nr:TIGR03936 family radical SAM-associated protein [Bacillota bacterium]